MQFYHENMYHMIKLHIFNIVWGICPGHIKCSEHLIHMYVYFISKSVNISYNTTQEYILYNITQR